MTERGLADTSVFIARESDRPIDIEVMPERLSGYGISLQQVAQTIRTANS